MTPPPEVVHWMFAVGFLFLGLCLLAETIVGREVWRRRSWRAYLWPSVAFLMGILMWPVMVFFTSSAIHMLAHGVWAQAMMVAAHGSDLEAARACGLRTAFVARPTEFGPNHAGDVEPAGGADVVAADFGALAQQLQA